MFESYRINLEKETFLIRMPHSLIFLLAGIHLVSFSPFCHKATVLIEVLVNLKDATCTLLFRRLLRLQSITIPPFEIGTFP
jgi:hypothetical protein